MRKLPLFFSLLGLSLLSCASSKKLPPNVKVSLEAWVNLMPHYAPSPSQRGKVLVTVTGLEGDFEAKKILLKKGDRLLELRLTPVEPGNFVSEPVDLKKDELVYGKVFLTYKGKTYKVSTDTARVQAVY